VFGFTNERDTPLAFALNLRRVRCALHPFGAGARLARAASADQQPGGPGLAVIAECGRELVIVAVQTKTPVQFDTLTIRQTRQKLAANLRRPLPPFVAKARDG
jgi:hypothetical protein